MLLTWLANISFLVGAVFAFIMVHYALKKTSRNRKKEIVLIAMVVVFEVLGLILSLLSRI